MIRSCKAVFTVLLTLALTTCDDAVKPVQENVEPIGQLYFPPMVGDEWEVVEPEALGWDKAALADLVTYTKNRHSYSLIILYNGRVVVEEYWNGSGRDSKHPIESVTKSVIGLLVGVLQDKYDFDINNTVNSYIGADWSAAPADREAPVTIKHLLSMTSGLNENLESVAAPGTAWIYSTAASDILFSVFKPVSDLDAYAFSKQYLLSRIGLESSWVDKTLHGTARDMARFGLLILAEGKWQDEHILNDRQYFSDMLNSSQTIQPAYGYLWWLNGKSAYYEDDVVYPGPLHPSMPADGVIAAGRDDQRIEIIASEHIVVVRQGENPQTPERGESSFSEEFWTRLNKVMRKN